MTFSEVRLDQVLGTKYSVSEAWLVKEHEGASLTLAGSEMLAARHYSVCTRMDNSRHWDLGPL